MLLDVEIILNNQLPILTSKSMVLRRDASRIKKEAIVKSISNTLNDVKEMDGRDGNSSF